MYIYNRSCFVSDTCYMNCYYISTELGDSTQTGRRISSGEE